MCRLCMDVCISDLVNTVYIQCWDLNGMTLLVSIAGQSCLWILRGFGEAKLVKISVKF